MRRIIATSLTAVLMGGAGTAFSVDPTAFPSALPPVANAGECYAQVKIPAQYSTGSESVVTAEGFTKLGVRAPEFQTRTETVLTKEASTRYVVRQPSYKSVRERILTRPGHDTLSVSAPQFSTVTDTIQTSAPHLVWKRGNPAELQRQGYVIRSTADGRLRAPAHAGGYQGGSYASTLNGGDTCGAGCEIWCLVEEPGTSVTTTRRALTAPPRVVRTPVPAEYKTITKQVVADPGGVQEIPVQAEYSSVQVQDLVHHAETYEVSVPPVVGHVGTKVLISPERYEWRRVICQPGTGHTRSNSTYSGEGQYSSGTTYSQSGSSYSSQPSYASGGHVSYGTEYSSGTTYTQGSSVSQPHLGQGSYEAESETVTGHYGTEDYPAYKRRGSSRIRRR